MYADFLLRFNDAVKMLAQQENCSLEEAKAKILKVMLAKYDPNADIQKNASYMEYSFVNYYRNIIKADSKIMEEKYADLINKVISLLEKEGYKPTASDVVKAIKGFDEQSLNNPTDETLATVGSEVIIQRPKKDGQRCILLSFIQRLIIL